MRKSCILMHISSLPSEYGIGKMGRHAFEFVDFLKKQSGQGGLQRDLGSLFRCAQDSLFKIQGIEVSTVPQILQCQQGLA